MLDIETMGTDSFSAVVSIAAVQFDLKTGKIGEKFYENITLKSARDIGLHTDPLTVEWWSRQSKEAQQALKFNAKHITKVMTAFSEFMSDKQDHRIWGNGSRFDLGLVLNICTKLHMPQPWRHTLERDVRTLVDFAPEVKTNMKFKGTVHNALSDCLHQIKYCTAIFKRIKVSKSLKNTKTKSTNITVNKKLDEISNKKICAKKLKKQKKSLQISN